MRNNVLGLSGSLASLKEKLAAMTMEAPSKDGEPFGEPEPSESCSEPCCEIGTPDVIGAPCLLHWRID